MEIQGTAATTTKPRNNATMYPMIGLMPSSGLIRLMVQAA